MGILSVNLDKFSSSLSGKFVQIHVSIPSVENEALSALQISIAKN